LNCRISSFFGWRYIQLDHSCWPVLHRLVMFLRIVDRVDIPTGVPFTSYPVPNMWRWKFQFHPSKTHTFTEDPHITHTYIYI
jgi:hypothetical protein